MRRRSGLGISVFACSFLFATAIHSATVTADPGRPGTGIAQPTTYKDSSGTYSLFIDPSDRFGRGKAKYRFVKNGEEVWSDEREYTLREVTVTDNGFGVGIAYRSVPKEKDGQHEDPVDFFHFVILNEKGHELVRSNEQRPRNPFMASPPPPKAPYAEQIVVDPPSDRVILRIMENWGPAGHNWRIYRLSTGELLDRFDPKTRLRNAQVQDYVVDSRVVPGTPLILVHWYTKGPDFNIKDDGGRFDLVGFDGEPVWTLRAEKDYVDLDLHKRSFTGLGPVDYFRQNPAILTCTEPGRFEIRIFAKNERVTFQTKWEHPEWIVTEVTRVPFSEANSASNASGVVGTLRSLGAIKLAADGEETATIKYVSRFTFDRDGNIYFLGRRPDEPMTLAGVDQNGRLLSKRPFTTLNTNTSWWPSWNDLPRIKDNHFVMMRKTSEGTDDWLAFLVDLTNGEEEPYSAFPRGVFGSVARFPDGSLVVVTRFDVHPTDTDDQVALYDATGQKVWRVRSVEQPDGDWKWSTIREVTVTRRDEIALLASNTVYILDRQGKLIRKIDLTGAFGRTEFGGRTGYLSDIVADAEGGFVLWDFGNPPVVLRYSSDGTVRSRWSPRHPDGRTFTIRPGVQVAPDGRLWTSDGSSFMRLTDDGVVDLVLGDAPASTAIEGVAGLTVGSDGTIYVVSKPTGGIHVFDSGGGLLRIDAPDPTDFPGTVETAFIAVTDRGDYYVQRPATKVHTPPDEYLHFSPEGDRIGFMTFEPRFSDGQWGPNWCFQPETGYRCGLSGPHDTLTMVDPPNTLIREIRKRPNGKWFSRVSALAIAPDGTMATLNSELGAEPALFEVDLWTEAGDPVRTIQLPTPKKNFTGLAYDGKRIVVAGNEEVLIISPDGSIIERWALSETGAAKGRWQAYILPGGRKLLLHETAWNFKAPVIHRFELP